MQTGVNFIEIKICMPDLLCPMQKVYAQQIFLNFGVECKMMSKLTFTFIKFFLGYPWSRISVYHHLAQCFPTFLKLPSTWQWNGRKPVSTVVSFPFEHIIDTDKEYSEYTCNWIHSTDDHTAQWLIGQMCQSPNRIEGYHLKIWKVAALMIYNACASLNYGYVLNNNQ